MHYSCFPEVFQVHPWISEAFQVANYDDVRNVVVETDETQVIQGINSFGPITQPSERNK